MPALIPLEPPPDSALGRPLPGGMGGRLLSGVLLAVGLSLAAAAAAGWALRMDVGVTGRGVVLPAVRSHAKARAAGLVRAVLVRHGQRVEAGSVVARLDDDALRANLARLKHDLEANAVRQAGVRQDALRRRSAGTAQVEQARLAADQARLQLEALRVEYDQPVGPILARLGWRRRPFAELVPVRQQQALLGQREAELRRALEEEQAARQVLVELRVLEGERRQLEDERHQVSLRLGEAAVLAPISGTVLTLRPEDRVGDRVTDGEAVVELAAMDSWVAEVGLAEADVHRVRTGQRARIYVTAFPEAEYSLFSGDVAEISLVPATGQYPVRLRIADPRVRAGSLACGMGAEARIVVDRQRIAVLVWHRLLDSLGRANRRGVGVSEAGP